MTAIAHRWTAIRAAALVVAVTLTGCATRGLWDKDLEALAAVPDSEINMLIGHLSGSEWRDVTKAAFALESKEGRSIPALVELLHTDDYIKLKNTADLIYPGAETYWGHGLIVNYDIDWLPVRAGWVLERITFEDFGFSENSIDHDALLRATARGQVDVPLEDVATIDRDATMRAKQRTVAVQEAIRWWEANQVSWRRRPALIAALVSNNHPRIHSALHWIRFDESPIAGFSKDFYLAEVYPIVERLAGSSDASVAEQAQYLVDDLADDEWWWLDQKLGVTAGD